MSHAATIESFRAQLADMTRQRDEARAAWRTLDGEVNGPLGLRFGLNERTRELATERERHDYTSRALDEFQGAWASARAAVQSVTNERPDGDVVTFVVESIGRLAIDLDAATSARDALLRALDVDSLTDALDEIADLRADASRADSERHARKAAERERDTHRQHAIEMEAEADRLRVEYDSDPRTVHLMGVVRRLEGELAAANERAERAERTLADIRATWIDPEREPVTEEAWQVRRAIATARALTPGAAHE